MIPASHSMTGNISLSGAKRVTVPVTRPDSFQGRTGGVGSCGFGIVRTAEVGDGDLVRLADPYVDAIARAVHGLVDRVVEDLAHEVMQSPQIGRPDVRAGTTANGLETFEDLDVARAVRAALRCHLGWFFPDGHAHAFPARTRSS